MNYNLRHCLILYLVFIIFILYVELLPKLIKSCVSIWSIYFIIKSEELINGSYSSLSVLVRH
ncbi:GPI mannosyltransferase [Cryptosporidium meleagridis]